MSDLGDLTLAEAASLLHRRQASAQELTEACLARISVWQPIINAFLAVDADKALKAAKATEGVAGVLARSMEFRWPTKISSTGKGA